MTSLYAENRSTSHPIHRRRHLDPDCMGERAAASVVLCAEIDRSSPTARVLRI
jgi:hypothetical protein